MLSLVFLIVAIILFVIAACGVPTPRVSLAWLGMAFFAASFLVGPVSLIHH